MRLRTALAAIALAVSLSACQVVVTYTTEVAQDGSGTFTFQIALDRAAANELGEQRTPALFGSLEDKGWSIERTEPDGGLVLSASRAFSDPHALDDVFEELGAAREDGDAGEFDGIDLALRLERSADPISTKTDFRGSIGFGSLQDLPADAKAELGRAISFRVVADLPGDARVVRGSARFDDLGRVVWEPLFGEAMHFSARSSVRDPTLFLIMLLGGAGLLLFVFAFVARNGRKRRRLAALEAFRIEQAKGVDDVLEVPDFEGVDDVLEVPDFEGVDEVLEVPDAPTPASPPMQPQGSWTPPPDDPFR